MRPGPPYFVLFDPGTTERAGAAARRAPHWPWGRPPWASGARSLGCFGQIVALPRRPGQGCRGSAVLVESSSRPSGARAAQHLLRSKAAVTGRRRFVVVESELASKPDEMRALLR